MRFSISEGSTQGLVDAERFVGEIETAARDLFIAGTDIIVTRAPGRLDVMGGIADYSGSLVLQLPIAEATFAALQGSDDRMIRVVSHDRERGLDYRYEIELDQLGELTSGGYEGIAASFSRHDHWASYVVGAFSVLAKERNIDFDRGINIYIASDVPIGKGVSSSAAVEVAVMQGVCAAYGIELEPRELALLSQTVENQVVGAACGVMDQMTSHCGRANHLLALVCQPAELLDPVPIPDDLEFWGIDSGVRHAVVGSDYSSVRAAAFMGYRIIADAAGLDVSTSAPGKVHISDDRWNGYLANVTVDEYERDFRDIVPLEMLGEDFLAKFAGSTDTVTSIDKTRKYQVRVATEHAIYESDRVRCFYALITAPLSEQAMTDMDELMFSSHSSYGACGLSEPRTDRLVDMVRQRITQGLIGARITGGGSGGTVAVASRKGSTRAINEIVAQYADETGYQPKVFSSSSPGCSDFGYLRLRPGAGV